VKILNTSGDSFYLYLQDILQKRSQQNLPIIDEAVKNIINDVISRGDEALFDYSKKFDESIIDKENILISKEIRLSYRNKVDPDIMDAFRVSIKNVTNFHSLQKPHNYEIKNKGVKTALIWKTIQSVGLYVPGGEAIYPSSVIMNVVPAKVAGVKRIVVVTPSKLNEIDPYILAILDELDISEIYQIGGAHAIAALAYGTESIDPVNKIFGPGNAYVASAKKQVFGKVGIDLIAGPSEILVVADRDNNPEWIAADIIAQAEHDERSQSILITDDDKFSSRVLGCLENLVSGLPKKLTITKSLENNGIIIIDPNFKNVNSIIDFIAPEHLHLQNKTRNEILKKVNNVGAIFLGEYSTEAFGDYIAGTNHILPTSGSARFSSGVGVLDFMKRSSLIEMDIEGFNTYKDNVIKMAQIEKLEGHKLSVKIRQIEKK
jgi:histidinol dehydrogenase